MEAVKKSAKGKQEKSVILTQTSNSCSKVSQDRRTSVTKLTLDGKLSFHIYLTTPSSQECNNDAGKNKNG